MGDRLGGERFNFFMQISLKIQIFVIVIEAKISVLCKGTVEQRALEQFRQWGLKLVIIRDRHLVLHVSTYSSNR